MPEKKKVEFDISGEDLKVLALPILTMISILVACVFVGNFAYGKIYSQMSNNAGLVTAESALKAKVVSLSTLPADISSEVLVAAQVLPQDNSGLSLITLVRTLASANSLEVTEFRSSPESPSENIPELKSSTVTFDITGEKTGVLSFLLGLGKIAPINSIEKVAIQNTPDGLTSATVDVKAYWSAFPTTISAITEPVTIINEADQAVLAEISEYILPSSQTLPVSGGKPNPFE